MVEVDDTRAAALAAALSHLADLADAPVSGMTSPTSGLRAIKSTNSARSASVQIVAAERSKGFVSATVMGLAGTKRIYVIDA